MRRLCLLLLLLPCSAFAFEAFFQGYGRAGDFREGGGAHAWIPLYQGPNYVTFGEMRLLRMREQWNGSGGGGVRAILFDGIGVGANAFFDYSRADGAGAFWQGCGGVELFGNCWDVTAHYYYPDRSPKVADTRTEFVPIVIGTQIFADEFLVFDRVRAYRGYDVNVGLEAPLCWGRLKGCGGYFRYTAPNSRVVEGPRLRLYWEIDSPFLPWTGTRWAIGGEWQYDNVRKEQAAVVVSLRFNLCSGPGIERCKPCVPGICRRMGELVDREYGITIIRDEERQLIDQQLIANLFFVEQNGMGVGTQTDPTNLLFAETNSVAGDFIFLLNNMGPIAVSSLPDDTFDMKTNQTLVSFDDASSVELNLGTFGILTITDLTGAGRGILAGATMPSVALANNVLIDGIGISGGPVGITSTGITTATITKTDIIGATTAGIEIGTSSGITITDCGFGILNTAISTTNAIDLNLTGNTGAFMVSGSRFENTGTNSVVINGGSATYTFTNNTIVQTGGRAIEIGTTTGAGGTIAFTGGSITNSGGTGIIVDTSSAAVSIANATITSSTTDSVTLTTNTGSFILDNAMISGAAFRAVNGSTAANVTIQNSTIDSMALPVASQGAIELVQASGTTTLSGNTISNISGATNRAIRVSNTNLGSTIAVTNNAISGSSNTVNGVELVLAGTGATTTTVTQNTLQGLTARGIEVAKTGTGGSVTSTVSNNMISNHGSSQAIFVLTNGQGTTHTTSVENNTVNVAADEGIRIEAISTGASAQTFNGTISGNTLTAVMGPDRTVAVSNLSSGDTFRSLIENNTYSGAAAASARAFIIEALGDGTISGTMNSNTDSSGSTGSAAYIGQTAAGFAGTLCTDFTGNNTNNTQGIEIINAAGTFNVAPSNVAATLSAANNSIGTVVGAGTAAAGSCPLPP